MRTGADAGVGGGSGTRWQAISGSAAEIYAQHLAPGMFTPWAPVLVEHAEVQPGDVVLDVACGTGVVTRAAAEVVGSSGRVVGLDFSAGMLAAARAAGVAQGVTVEWIEADAVSMPLADATFDVVLCQHGLQQIPDRAAALAEMRRMLRPGGRVGISVWSAIDGSPGMLALVQALGRHVSTAAAANRRAPFALGDADELRELIAAAGFEEVRLHTLALPVGFPTPEALVDAQLAATPLATLGAISAETHAAVRADVRAALADYLQDGRFTAPMEVHLVTARCVNA